MPVTREQVQKGTRSKSLNFGWMEVVSEPYESGLQQGDFKVDVRFDDTGCVRKGVVDRYFIGGYVRDGSVSIPRGVGGRYNTINSGVAEITEYSSTKQIIVTFLDTGNRQDVQLDSLVSGLVKDQKWFEGTRVEKEAAEEVERLERERAAAENRYIRQQEECERQRLHVQRLAEWEAKRVADELRSQARWERLEARRIERLSNIHKILQIEKKELDQEVATKGTLNIDFKDRDGNWVLRFSMNGTFIQTRLGKLHNNLTQRVKKGGAYEKFSASYLNVGISEEFLDAQKFCDWAVAQPGWGMGYQLDKDLLCDGTKIYSAETCLFLPQEINVALIPSRKGRVSFSEDDGYVLNATIGGREFTVPGFMSEDAALDAMRKYREAYVHKLAVEFIEGISERAFDALKSWNLNIRE